MEKIEGVYSLSPLFSQMLIHGDSLRSHLICIGVLDPVQGSQFINKVTGKSLQPTDIEGMRQECKNPKVKAAVVKSLSQYAKQAKLNGCVSCGASEVGLVGLTTASPSLQIRAGQAGAPDDGPL